MLICQLMAVTSDKCIYFPWTQEEKKGKHLRRKDKVPSLPNNRENPSPNPRRNPNPNVKP